MGFPQGGRGAGRTSHRHSGGLRGPPRARGGGRRPDPVGRGGADPRPPARPRRRDRREGAGPERDPRLAAAARGKDAPVRTVALDVSSRSSAAMVRILLEELYGLRPEYHEAVPDLSEMLRHHDAALLIGDPALTADLRGLSVLDLAEGWRRLTGLPFVFAVWAVRPSVPPEPFLWSRDYAQRHFAELVDAATARTGLPREVVSGSTSTEISTTISTTTTRRGSPSSTAGRSGTASSRLPTFLPSRACRWFPTGKSDSRRRSGRVSLFMSGRRSSRERRSSRTRRPPASAARRVSRRSSSASPSGSGSRCDDALVLFREATLLELGAAAHAVRCRMQPPERATYQVDRNINYTNVCIYRCTFCAFYRKAGDAEGATSSPLPEIGRKVEETIALGGTGDPPAGGGPRGASVLLLRGAARIPPRALSRASTGTPSPRRRSTSSRRRSGGRWPRRSGA